MPPGFDFVVRQVANLNVFDCIVVSFLVGLTWLVERAIFNIYFHPLAAFPGPPIAAVTGLYKAYIDVAARSSFVHTLEKLHSQYGDVVRVGPNELHFSRPETYHEIYNANNRWDKERSLYHSFGEDRSSFGFLEYKDAKSRKDVLSRVFSKKAIQEAEGLIEEKASQVIGLCESFSRHADRPVDLFYAFRCMSIDVITYLCFGNSVDAINAPDHKAPIIVAMDASLPVFVAFKHSSLYKNMIIHCPPTISKFVSPATSGLVDLQQVLKQQIKEVTSNPENLKKLPHSTTIYHELLRPELYRDHSVPDPGSLYEESQALMFGGADTTGTTLMHGSFYILTNPEVYKKLRTELQGTWPILEQPPSLVTLQKLPYLTGVIKEALRMSPGVASPLPRVVPAPGVTLADKFIPGGTIVEMSSHFVHRNPTLFDDADQFKPERWLDMDGKQLERWLVSFSRGARSCLGLNLAWAELYLTFAHLFRKFHVEIDPSSPKELKWRDCFLPEYIGPHLRAKVSPVAA
ncbi:uncharacterized protein Z518_03530 [Rhinocladiella mackenziei CBS 650.93]|uniref:Cytochrome P450 monooxygenase n=1 Tax=Rhinocladiella mackenziei CBS 650.93 TaxID=1442369 RepID=A0A0D2HE77_9EURO|nr:uncharacterized protein Z518_03530 [Rhinocladiella mackenziei CBS 650.93]KIX08873.1 hypothetical protein Z518_03530 [Rhinocladiella mackenziei CBS 650.93]